MRFEWLVSENNKIYFSNFFKSLYLPPAQLRFVTKEMFCKITTYVARPDKIHKLQDIRKPFAIPNTYTGVDAFSHNLFIRTYSLALSTSLLHIKREQIDYTNNRKERIVDDNIVSYHCHCHTHAHNAKIKIEEKLKQKTTVLFGHSIELITGIVRLSVIYSNTRSEHVDRTLRTHYAPNITKERKNSPTREGAEKRGRKKEKRTHILPKRKSA